MGKCRSFPESAKEMVILGSGYLFILFCSRFSCRNNYTYISKDDTIIKPSNQALQAIANLRLAQPERCRWNKR